MTYKLTFLESAKKEWEKLAPSIRNDFKKKLFERLENPTISKDKLSGPKDGYKIKLRTLGYRLVYRVFADRLVVQVVAIGRCDKNLVYNMAKDRMQQPDNAKQYS